MPTAAVSVAQGFGEGGSGSGSQGTGARVWLVAAAVTPARLKSGCAGAAMQAGQNHGSDTGDGGSGSGG